MVSVLGSLGPKFLCSYLDVWRGCGHNVKKMPSLNQKWLATVYMSIPRIRLTGLSSIETQSCGWWRSRAGEHQRNIRRCYTCGSTRHLRPNCPLRKPRKNWPSRNTALNQKRGTARCTGLILIQPRARYHEAWIQVRIVGCLGNKSSEKPWSILINSGASCNYLWCRSLEGRHKCAEALQAHESDVITVRLATGARVTVPKVSLILGVNF